MATTKTRAKPSTNGGKPAATAGVALRSAGDTAAAAARRARGPALAAGAAAVGIAGGLAVGARRHGRRRLIAPRTRLLGVPIGPKSSVLRAAELVRAGAKHFDSATGQLSGTADDMRRIREQLEQVNRRSPLEVVLDGLTHRRGAHRHEG
jgi:hypothetical protein